jgi:hypothetical protein
MRCFDNVSLSDKEIMRVERTSMRRTVVSAEPKRMSLIEERACSIVQSVSRLEEGDSFSRQL